ncbi:sarcosine oxidase, gamma subunit, partial [Pseudomonas syringae pv. actinidiae ICMP 18807]
MTSLTTDRPVELDAPSLCTLEDLTDLPRVGFRGTQTADYLTARGFILPETPNRA